MPLNILHHKSWNVYNTENIERVKRDEAKAKEEEQKKKERAIQAEREFRLSLLRKKNSINTESNSNSNNISLTDNLNENGHINLFYKEVQQLNSGKNEEREEEEKKQKEKFESQFIYSLTGKDKETPWYSLGKSSDTTNKEVKDSNDNNNKLKRLRKDKKRKEIEDPLSLIKKNLSKNKEIELKFKESLPYFQREKKNDIINKSETFTNPTELLKEFSKKRKSNYNSSSSSDSSSDSSSSESDSSSSSDYHKKRRHDKRKKHHHHHSHHHKHGHKHNKSSKKHNKNKRKHHSSEEDKHDSKSTIEKLREERFKREQEERQRALNISGIQQSLSVNKVEEDKYFYNSQFNPDSIRQLRKN